MTKTRRIIPTTFGGFSTSAEKKFEFKKHKVEFAGLLVSIVGSRIHLDMVAEITDFLAAMTLTSMRSFHGLSPPGTDTRLSSLDTR